MYTPTDELVQDYQVQIDRIREYVEIHIDDPLSREELAAISGFSLSHLHRIFKAFVGESLAAYVRRMRLERAMYRIVESEQSVTDTALCSGYDTPAAFTKAFRKQFGVNPSMLNVGDMTLAVRLIMEARTTIKDAENRPREDKMVTPEIRTRQDQIVASIRDADTFEGIYRAWDKLGEFMDSAKEIITDDWETLGILHDVPASEDLSRADMRYDACVGIRGTSKATEKASTFENITVQTLAGGRYAVFLHSGELEKLDQTWGMAYKEWLPSSGEQVRNAPPFEMYLDSPEVPAAERKTEIYIPLE